jgi:1-aminocyclopropane-1-carboxylate deaminase
MIHPQFYDYPVSFSDELDARIRLTVRTYGNPRSEISGNKAFKMYYWLENLVPDESVISFGGAYSNHLLALSAKGKYESFRTIGIIRGERPKELGPYLQAMQRNGMELEFISREAYKRKESPEFLKQLETKFGKSRIIPEGGAGNLGVQGAMEMVNANEPFDYVFLPGATATTVAGIALKLQNSSTRVGCVQVLKGENILRNELLRSTGIDLSTLIHVDVFEQFHFGGYAKTKPELIEFQEEWQSKTEIPIDLVYGSKALFGLIQLAQNGQLPKNSRILYLHTGGIGPDDKIKLIQD